LVISGKITVVDYDKVSPSNLNRQLLFREDDIGEEKVAVGRRISASLNSEIDYQFILIHQLILLQLVLNQSLMF